MLAERCKLREPQTYGIELLLQFCRARFNLQPIRGEWGDIL